ncbi:hypothetical protein D3C86_1679050 [compost metagenome]
MNKYIPKDATIFHIADDFGQKDILLTLQQASRKIFTFIKNEEKRQIAENNYLVKRRKLNYINEISKLEKEIDVLLISDNSFKLSEIQELPETVIFINAKNVVSEFINYNLVHSSASIMVLRRK